MPTSDPNLAFTLLEGLTARRGVALRFHDGSAWTDLAFPDVVALARRSARGLIALGVEPGDRVAILSETQPQWTLADLAILWAGAVVVPVYHSNTPQECAHVLRDAGVRAIFCEDATQVDKIAAVVDALPDLRHIIAFDDSGGKRAIALEELRRRGDAVDDAEVAVRAAAPAPGDPCTLVYTSGTTGAPKGCVLTHANLLSNLAMVARRVPLEESSRAFLWLPLAHVLARMVQFSALMSGASLGYWRGDPQGLLDDLLELEPTHLPSVPRLFEKVHTRVLATAGDSALRSRMLAVALWIGRRRQLALDRGRRPGLLLGALHRLADALVLGRIRALFGSRLQLALTGAAPIDVEILRFFHAAGVYLLEGYGMTETTAVVSINTLGEHRFGTVGRPLPECEVRIDADGEVLVRGPQVFAGYFGDDEATAEILIDGWLHTGDLGALDPDGYLAITGRKKDIIITASGKNVTPTSIENVLTQSRWISQAVVYGDRRPYLVALLTLDPAEAPALAAVVGANAHPTRSPGGAHPTRPDDELDPDALAALAADPRVHAEIARVVEEVNTRFARAEQIKRFAVLERDLTQEDGELTPTQKIKRAVVYERHRERFDELYEGGGTDKPRGG